MKKEEKTKLGAKEWNRREFPRVSHLKVTKDKALDWCIKKYSALKPDVLAKYGLKLVPVSRVIDDGGSTIKKIQGCWDCPLCTHYIKKEGSGSHDNCSNCPIYKVNKVTCNTSGAWSLFINNCDPLPMLHLLMKTKEKMNGDKKLT